jgi:hypothetical protein
LPGSGPGTAGTLPPRGVPASADPRPSGGVPAGFRSSRRDWCRAAIPSPSSTSDPMPATIATIGSGSCSGAIRQAIHAATNKASAASCRRIARCVSSLRAKPLVGSHLATPDTLHPHTCRPDFPALLRRLYIVRARSAAPHVRCAADAAQTHSIGPPNSLVTRSLGPGTRRGDAILPPPAQNQAPGYPNRPVT